MENPLKHQKSHESLCHHDSPHTQGFKRVAGLFSWQQEVWGASTGPQAAIVAIGGPAKSANAGLGEYGAVPALGSAAVRGGPAAARSCTGRGAHHCRRRPELPSEAWQGRWRQRCGFPCGEQAPQVASRPRSIKVRRS